MIRELQDEIIRLKKEKDICILAHSYQNEEIIEVADFVGDSFQLSLKAKEAPQKIIIMCGVRFMAETVKMLSPEKTVYLVNPDAGCEMADMVNKERILSLKEQYPDYTVVAYINTTTDLKTVCDVCVTSSSAVKIINGIENKNILFVPDCNLGAYVTEQCPDKNIKLIDGCCPIHAKITAEDVEKAKEKHPDALFLVHPECKHEVVEMADYVGSTSGIMDYAKKSEHKEFIIGTENSIYQHLQNMYPDKKFYPLHTNMICHNMKITTLTDILNCIKGEGGEEMQMSEQTRLAAVKCINKMIELG